ncbi:polyribonucleotide nucleotidyltransferase 1, mitochondrial [Helicoverpa zea]|uniref:polyribonucleotide nucleotidyltransferase 1, mitochondrial n=1 Tax=Helicoverpa zea TaxID=7113 RepID=UPI001F5720A7|nr:polyribonucleotide nucleotidyltransferase 1, mitochondrial [Helicoverpa zea]
MLSKKRLIVSRIANKGRCFRCFATKSDVGEIEIPFSNGTTIKFETGKYARFADAACVANLGNTAILSTVVSKAKQSAASFLPLVVDYRQKAAAAGRIPTNFLRRELGPTEREILTSRLIDRSLRPLFPSNYFYDTQIVCNMLAVDATNPPETVAINAASAALALSDVPWNGPVGAVRVGQIDNEVIINPTRKDLQNSILNLVVAATNRNLVVMMEGSAQDILQQDLLKAIKLGTKEAQHIVKGIEKLQKLHGKTKRVYETPPGLPQEIVDSINTLSSMKIREILSDYSHDKMSRDNAISDLRQTVLNQMRETEADVAQLQDCFNANLKSIFRDMIFEKEIRCDGRHLDELRQIGCQVSLYEPLHGSAVFQRGQTQVLCTVAFDSADSALKMDTLTMLTSGIKEKSFFLHYEFPSYATGEVGRSGPAGRREAGHGALAERGLLPVVPQLPYTVRLTAEVLESNGSSSMASVCGGSLALMDAGVPLTAPAAGVAIGLVSRPDQTGQIADYRILTDLLGIEDYMGDMDFKIAGTKKGITALQADIKVSGLPLKIVMESVQKACDAKSKIIDIMNKCIDKPREGHKENMPVIEEMEVEVHKRPKLLGMGGANLKKLYVETGVQVTPIDDIKYSVFAPSQAAMDEARSRIASWLNTEKTPELEFGAIYKARVVEVKDIGVLVTLFTGMTPALVHNMQLDHRKIQHPSVLGLDVGSEIQVKYFGRDPVSGHVRLSRKVLTSPPPGIVKKLDKS